MSDQIDLVSLQSHLATGSELALTFGGPPVVKVGGVVLVVAGFRPPQLGSRAAAGRRVSDRVATLDAGENGRTMGDEDDVTGWSWRPPWLAGQVVSASRWWGAAGAQTYLGARTCNRSGQRIDGVCPAGSAGCGRSIY